MKKSRKLLSLILTSLVVSASITGCGSKSAAQADGKKSIKMGVSFSNMTNPYYLEMRDNMKAAVKSGDDLLVTEANQDSSKQVNDIEDMIQQGVDVIFLNCVDSKAVKPALEQCKKANIPVIAIDSAVSSPELVSCTVASDNVQAGRLCAEALAKKIGGKGDIVMYENTLKVVTADRSKGFDEAIKKYPDIKIVNRQNGAPNIESAMPVMENFLQANPEIVGAFALNDPSAQGMISAIISSKKLGQVNVVSVDGSANGKKLIKEGKLLGSAAQSPDVIGKTAVESAYKILNKETVEKSIKIPVIWIDASNVDKYIK